MAAVLTLAAVVGVSCSITLQFCGLSAMWLRYPLALATAYAAFLALLGVLVGRAARKLTGQCHHLRHDALRRQYRKGEPAPPELADFLDQFSDGMQDSGREVRDPRAIPAFVALWLSITVVLICIYFVWMAPVLLAQLIAEGALITSLYRPLARGLDPHWLSVALEETGGPTVIMAACLALTGVCFQLHAPAATNIVDVWRSVAQQAAAPQPANPRGRILLVR
jgi:hypothetical protein